MNSTFFTVLALLLINIDALNTSSLLINCGLPKPTKSYVDGSLWQSDDDPSFAPPNLNTVSTVAHNEDPTGELPYQVGRVFWSNITYTFSITPAAPIFLRLYFFPHLTFNNTLPHQFSISLFANNFTLFNNFNPFLNSPIHNSNFYEFQLILGNGENNLNLTFSPASAAAPSSIISYGYVNGIEIESIPEGLYIDETNLNYRYVLDTKNEYQLDLNSAAFQTAFRLNVGGELVSGAQDNPGGMRRTWEADEKYLYGPRGVKYQPGIDTNPVIKYTKKTPPYVAAKLVYETVRTMGDNPAAVNLGRNLTWVFKVDPGFDYVVRFHWREMDLSVTGTGQRSMRVYIGGYVADEGIDIWDEAGGSDIPIYKDYVITIPGTSNGSTVPLSLALHPNYAYVTDVTLNGVEILKLSRSDRILAVPNPPYNGSDDRTNSQNQGPNRKSSIRKMVVIIGGVIGGVLIVSTIILALLRRRVQHRKRLASSAKSSSNGQWTPLWVGSRSSTATTKANSSRASSLPSDLCRRFSLSEIRVATSDFDEDLVVGTGGFGKVYKGIIDDGASTVAIKRLNSTSKQGEHEFLTEIEMLSRLRHLHLVSLIGYCEDQGEMILVYEYMPRGTLRDHLHYKDATGKDDENENDEVLPWKQRLTICIGSARGLDYLHSGAKQVIIHRDVKSTNILLDDKWTAKVSDFGLSKVGPASDTGVGHVSTLVKGSFGYLDPEYYKRGQLSEKSDVFSFGVVLFEVLCARPAVSPNLPKEQMNLAKWARSCYKKGMLHTIVDPNLTGQIAPECLRKFGETADMCLKNHWDERPTMKDVVWSLEFALTLQQTAEKNTRIGSPMVDVSSNDNAIDNVDSGGGGGGGGGFVSRYDENISRSSGVEVESRVFGSSSGSDATTNSTVTNYHMDFKSGSIFSEILDPRAR